MQGDFPAFCHRQSTKMMDYAEVCTDPALKAEFLEMSAFWLRRISAPTKPTKQSAFDSMPTMWATSA
jgi:hypothetical protein